ncbi:hypothetical protein HOY82DRAFT_608268 [Tuber indicum]|nr:hypothetical protein HOY82DRAFT_608268 [Tuber indicum]
MAGTQRGGMPGMDQKIELLIDRTADLPGDSEVGKARITSSPLDYHVFGQEIPAKHPAYGAPDSLFPVELASYLFVPSSTVNTAKDRPGGKGDALFRGNSGCENLGWVLDHAVPIATPSPSPPPAPWSA